MGWKPILDGDLQERAMEAVHAIAEDLRLKIGNVDNPTLSHGLAGLAVFFSYLARTRSGYGDEEMGIRLLSQAMDMVEMTPMHPALQGGFLGVAWSAAHFQDQFGDSDPLADVDEVLLQVLGDSPWEGDYDLVRGLVGYGLYALERLPWPKAHMMLERVVDRLAELSECSEEGVAWFTRPELLPEKALKESPYGQYNLGLAHGAPGVIGFLGCAVEAGAATEKARELLNGSVNWLLAQRLAESSPAAFARCLGPGVKLTPARLAWCYGDLGVASALWVAARGVGNSAWEREAIAIAQRGSVRPLAESGVLDAGFCHGAAGVAHMFNRLSQATGDSILAESSRYWLEQTLDLRRPGEGVGGYLSRIFVPNGPDWEADPHLLNGAVGIGLVLLAACTSISPDWDRMFLLSSPVKGGDYTGKETGEEASA